MVTGLQATGAIHWKCSSRQSLCRNLWLPTGAGSCSWKSQEADSGRRLELAVMPISPPSLTAANMSTLRGPSPRRSPRSEADANTTTGTSPFVKLYSYSSLRRRCQWLMSRRGEERERGTDCFSTDGLVAPARWPDVRTQMRTAQRGSIPIPWFSTIRVT